MKKVMIPALLLLGATVGCGRGYAVLQQPSKSMASYGTWEVPKSEVSEHIFNYYQDKGPEKWEQWKTSVHAAAEYLASETRRMLAHYKSGGANMRVDLKMDEYIPANFWRNGQMRATASFVDPADDTVVAVIQVPIRLVKYAGARYTEATYIGKIIAAFVLDYSK